MKKFFAVIALFSLTLLTTTSFAQYEKGDKLLNVGIGLGAGYGGGVPIGASLEVGITDDISVGGQIDYYSWSYGYTGGYNFRYTFIPIAARGSYHLNKVFNLSNDKVDLYAGAQLGYYISSYSNNVGYTGIYDNGYGNRILFGIHAGARYYFKPNLGAFAEAGYAVAGLKIGVAFKF